MSDVTRGGLAFALDVADVESARRAVDAVGDSVDMLKVGLELFIEGGPSSVRLGERVNRPVFLDLKLHDIPETVERAVARASALGARLLTVHASGGGAMLERAVARASKEGAGLVIAAVTVLTSLDQNDLGQAGISGTVEEHVVRLAHLAWNAGVQAFVCSAREVKRLRGELGREAILVTPGIRPSSDAPGDDQKRVATASDAIRDGATWLVVGRPIRDAKDPRAAAAMLNGEIARARGLLAS